VSEPRIKTAITTLQWTLGVEQDLLAELFSRSVMPKLLIKNDGEASKPLEDAWRFWTADLNGQEVAHQ